MEETAVIPKKKRRPMKKKTKVILTCGISLVLVLALVLGLILPLTFVHGLYSAYFAGHYASPPNLLAEYPELEALDSVKFRSNMGQLLTGRFYKNKNVETPKGLIVVSHGLGGEGKGGYLSYLPEMDSFARRGFLVFGYDNTGYGESEGDNRVGLAQSPVDLEFALLFLENREELKGLPLMLYGHSWGGYAVCSVLSQEHDIRAAVSRSGFNRSSDMLVEQGGRLYGDSISALRGYLYLYEHFKFGKVVDDTAVKGLKKTPARVLVLWGDRDEMISEASAIYGFREKYAGNRNVTPELLPGNDHNQLSTEQRERITDFFEQALL